MGGLAGVLSDGDSPDDGFRKYVFAGLGGLPDRNGFGVFWVDRRALAAVYNMEGAFNQLAVRLSPGASERAMSAVERSAETQRNGACWHQPDFDKDESVIPAVIDRAPDTAAAAAGVTFRAKH